MDGWRTGRTRRRMLLAGAGAGLTAALAACGEQQTTTTAQLPAGRATPVARSTPGAKSSAPATFQYWDWATTWRELIRRLVEGYLFHNGNVTIQWDIPADYWTKLQVAIAGDTAPDSWRMNGPNLPQWATLGLLEDLTSYFSRDKDAADSLKAMSPVIANYTKRNGKQSSMPFGQALSGIVAYNEDLVRSEGLTPPAELGAKWTWATFQEYAVKLTRRDSGRYGYFVDRSAETGWLPFVFADGGAMFDAAGKRAAIAQGASGAATREALGMLADLAARQRVSPSPDELKQETAESRFLNGTLAMWPQGSWQIKDLNEKAKGLKWDLAPLPLAPATRKTGSTNQMASVAMSKASKEKETVWNWVKFIGSSEAQTVISQYQFFPARLDAAESYYRPQLGPAHRALLRDVLAATQPLPWLDVAGNTSGWGPVVQPYIDQMMDGTLSVKDGVQQMHDRLNAAIENGFR